MKARSAWVAASESLRTEASSIRAVWMIAWPLSPSGSWSTGPTCKAPRSWMRTGAATRRVYRLSLRARRGSSGSTKATVETVFDRAAVVVVAAGVAEVGDVGEEDGAVQRGLRRAELVETPRRAQVGDRLGWHPAPSGEFRVRQRQDHYDSAFSREGGSAVGHVNA